MFSCNCRVTPALTSMANMRRAFREHTFRVAVHSLYIWTIYGATDTQRRVGGRVNRGHTGSRHTTGDLRHICLVCISSSWLSPCLSLLKCISLGPLLLFYPQLSTLCYIYLILQPNVCTPPNTLSHHKHTHQNSRVTKRTHNNYSTIWYRTPSSKL